MQQSRARGSSGKGFLTVMVLILSVALIVALCQVPQPWRGVLVAWILFAGTAGVFVMRVAKHHYRYRAEELARRSRKRTQRSASRQKKRRRAPAMGGLRVVADERSAGRRTI